MKVSLLKISVFLSLLIIIHPSKASDSLIFQCYTAQNKKIEIVRRDDVLHYFYGPNRKKEMELKEALFDDEIPELFSPNVRLAQKSGPYIYNDVEFENGEYTYIVTALSDINVPSKETFSGVYVTKNASLIAKIRCIDSTIKDNFESLHKKPR